ncbi:MAG: LUD domain-containing protein [Thaumarchaeota archaeon]|nr:LUD domain-containing protein [Candidatus Calditenuaceae archaeon]MDW8042844.1 LUD domain-containing protein [Nitrososphaerota archaeon]
MSLERRTSEALRERSRVERLWWVFEETKRSRDEGIRRLDVDELRLVRESKVSALRRLEELIEEVRIAVERAGGEVFLARDAEDARRTVIRVLKDAGVRTAIKSKSITSEEIRLNEALISAGIEVVETDLGERVVQLSGGRPSHILGPALHMGREEVAAILSRSLGEEVDPDPRSIVAAVRRHLREEMMRAAAGITGANAVDSETGTVVIVTNEGNEQFVVGFPELVVCVAGVEKLVKGLEAAVRIARVQSASATGRMPSYVTLYGPRWWGEGKRFVLVLLDNGRTEALRDPWLWQVNLCVRCGACFNVCNPYKTVSGLVFGGNYTGPIGIVWDSVTSGPETANGYSRLCLSCGLCELECPMGIRIPLLISRVKSFGRRGVRLTALAEGFGFYARLGSSMAGPLNKAQRSRSFRVALELLAGIDRNAPLPEFRGGTLRRALKASGIADDGEGAGSTVVYVPDTFASLIDWRVGLEAVALLRSLGYRVVVCDSVGTNMPAVQYGHLGLAARVAKRVVSALHPHVERGARVVVTEPTAGYCVREVFPALLGTQESEEVAKSTLNFTELVVSDGLHSRFRRSKTSSEVVYYHVSCHGRGTGLEAATRAVLESLGLKVVSEELGCCGMAGTWGMRKGAVGHGLGAEIGRMGSRRIAETRPELVVTESSICALQLRRFLNVPVLHTVSLIFGSVNGAAPSR